MATFTTHAEVLAPDHPLTRMYKLRNQSPGTILADILTQAGGVYETTTFVTPELRECIRAAAVLTSDDELLAIAGLSEVPVSLENCRELDPQTRIVTFSRLDVSPGEIPRWRRLPLPGTPVIPPSAIDHQLRHRQAVHIVEHARADGRFWRQGGQAAKLPA